MLVNGVHASRHRRFIGTETMQASGIVALTFQPSDAVSDTGCHGDGQRAIRRSPVKCRRSRWRSSPQRATAPRRYGLVPTLVAPVVAPEGGSAPTPTPLAAECAHRRGYRRRHQRLSHDVAGKGLPGAAAVLAADHRRGADGRPGAAAHTVPGAWRAEIRRAADGLYRL